MAQNTKYVDFREQGKGLIHAVNGHNSEDGINNLRGKVERCLCKEINDLVLPSQQGGC